MTTYYTSTEIRNLNFRPVTERIILNNLNPVVVGVKNEGDSLHTAICEALLPLDTQVVKSLARSVQVVNRYAYT